MFKNEKSFKFCFHNYIGMNQYIEGMMIMEVPIWEKLNLTIEEASAYSGIGICTLHKMAREANCPFVLYVGKKKLVKRRDLEKYLEKIREI